MRIALVAAVLLSSSLALSQVTPPSKLLESAITYTSGALRIKAFTVRPDASGRLPAVILNHGGTDGVTWATKQRARDLARAGFAVFAAAGAFAIYLLHLLPTGSASALAHPALEKAGFASPRFN